jgi:hypothetical protein
MSSGVKRWSLSPEKGRDIQRSFEEIWNRRRGREEDPGTPPCRVLVGTGYTGCRWLGDFPIFLPHRACAMISDMTLHQGGFQNEVTSLWSQNK